MSVDVDAQSAAIVDASPEPACPIPTQTSLCGNPASIVVGSVALPSSSTDETGTILIAMVHKRLGDPNVAGHPHWLWKFEDVDLSQPSFPFEVDMCEGNAIMWSEENCEYNLVAVLDRNGNGAATPTGWRPDSEDLVGIQTFDLSCHDSEATCLSMELDCSDGMDCLQQAPSPRCVCAPNSCNSEGVLCNP